MNTSHQTYRGKLQALAAIGKSVAFATSYQKPDTRGAFYLLDGEKLSLQDFPLESGGSCVVADEKCFWVGDAAGNVYHYPLGGKSLSTIATDSGATIVAMALLSPGRLAILQPTQVAVYDHASSQVIQTIAFDDEVNPATTLASDPTGAWLALGYKSGHISVYEAEQQEEYLLSETEKLHEGQVTALLFEPEELRFFSTGQDRKFLLTHARGKLEPEDRGRAHGHEKPISAMLLVPGGRVVTGSQDQTCKSWIRSGGTRPVTLDDGMHTVADLTLATIHDRPNLVAACADNSLRFFLIGADGKFGHATTKAVDAYAKAKKELADKDARTRQKALEALASYGDRGSLRIVNDHISVEIDPKLRLQAVEMLPTFDHPKTVEMLEAHLAHSDQAVRQAAFAGLRPLCGESDLHPLLQALPHPTVGAEAVRAIAELAGQDDLAMSALIRALDSELAETRLQVIDSLETIYPADSPEANLEALGSAYPDVRERSVVRLYQRGLLDDSRVKSALRRAGDDTDASVRHTAFYLSLLTAPRLADVVRSRDTDYHRQIWEIEQLNAEKKAKAPPKLKPQPVDGLVADDYAPLVQAMAARELDTALLGAHGLSLLGDTRALGLLLQLSRERDPLFRAKVCRALANLDDQRVVQRLVSMLDDDASEVRDAAYSGLDSIYSKTPISAAEAGLSSEHEDIRSRGLRTLVAIVKRKPPKKPTDPAWGLLLRALNDRKEKIHGEAFKLVLNQQIGGGGPESLRFVLGSTRPEIRRDVLTEIMGQIREPWAWDLLLEMFNDPDSDLRREAFDYALKHTKKRDAAPMAVALDSDYPDLRRAAVESLTRLATKDAQSTLVQAIHDEDQATRLAALDYLIDSSATDSVKQALTSPHVDTQLQAAIALAKHGAPEAFTFLLETASEPEPLDSDDIPTWKQRLISALIGLTEMGDSGAADLVFSLLRSEHADLRQAAARAMVMVTGPDDEERLEPLLQHEDAEVKNRAALALALNRSDLSAVFPILADRASADVISSTERLAASMTFESGWDEIVQFVDYPDRATAQVASHILALLTMISSDAEPSLALAGLASQDAQVRYSCAQLVEAYATETGLEEYVVGIFNEREKWDLPAEMYRSVAAWFTHGDDERVKLRLLHIMPLLGEEKPSAWQLAWQTFQERFGGAPEVGDRPETRPELADLQDLVFGTFVGLARDESQGQTIRLHAIRHLIRLGHRDAISAASVTQSMAPFLSDAQQEIRRVSFDGLLLLETDRTRLASDCIESGQIDMGVEGLKLLSSGSAKKQAASVLENVALNRDDDLSVRAAELLAADIGDAETGSRLLDAKYTGMRSRALGWLVADYEADRKVKPVLVKALDSKYLDTRCAAATALANFREKEAYDALLSLLDSDKATDYQHHIISGLSRLGDPRTPDALVDRLGDQAEHIDDYLLLGVIASFRQPEVVPRLLPLLEDKKLVSGVVDTIYRISGYDQDAPYDWDERTSDFSWMEGQHPRHDDVIASLLEKGTEIGNVPYQALSAAKVSATNAVDSALATLTHHAEADLRDQAMEIVGWRLKYRGGDNKPLLAGLEHKSPTTRFIAAEGLARAGQGDGMNILLSAVELFDDVYLRIRAVEALGELGDENAVEVLLQLADDDEHALQEAATEAIGHMGKSDQSEKIFTILSRLVDSSDGLATRAILGLRWFDTRDGWGLVRQRAQIDGWERWSSREAAVLALGYNDDPATRNVLLHLLEHSDYNTCDALQSARRLFGADSIEPDLASAKGGNVYWDEDPDDKANDPALRIRSKATAQQILDIYPHLGDDDFQAALANDLLDLDKLPLKEAIHTLTTSDRAEAVVLAARILGVDKSHTKDLAEAIDKWLGEAERLTAAIANDSYNYQLRNQLDSSLEAVSMLVWACGQSGAEPPLLALHDRLPDSGIEQEHRDRLGADVIKALAEGIGSAAVLKVLEQASHTSHRQTRDLAIGALVQLAPEQADAIGESLLSDRTAFDRVAAHTGKHTKKVIHSHLDHAHYQAVVLPHAVASGEQAGLVKTAADTALPDLTRLGAIEALAATGTEAAEDELAKIGKTEEYDEELRKAAWRGLRRSKRARAKQSA